MEVSFPADYPQAPFFLRMVTPRCVWCAARPVHPRAIVQLQVPWYQSCVQLDPQFCTCRLTSAAVAKHACAWQIASGFTGCWRFTRRSPHPTSVQC
jgi:hypothetical protein